MNKKILFMMFLMFTMVSVSLAKKPPTMPNSYDSTGVSARSFAMGYTGAAMPGSLEGVYYNSASLGFNNNEKIQMEASAIIIRNTDLDNNLMSYSDPIDLGFTSFVVNQKQGAISWRTFSSNDLKIEDGSNFYKKSEHIKAVTLSAANVNEAGVSFGLNLSYLYGTLSESSIIDGTPFAQTSSGNGFTMDIGIMAPVKGNIYFGINLEGKVLVLRAGAQSASVDKTDEIKYTYGAGINISIVSVSIAGETYKLENENVSQYSVSVKVLI